MSNNSWQYKATKHASSLDRGLLYGDGFFTTMRVEFGKIEFWPLHWRRIQECCEALGFPQPEENKVQSSILKSVENLTLAGVRLTVTRGEGGRGYTPPEFSKPQCYIHTFDVPSEYEKLAVNGAYLGVAENQLGQVMPALSGLKTLNRLEQVILKQELRKAPKFDDLIVCDSKGHAIEATAGNIFWRKDRQWYTPRLNSAGVRGVIREYILSVRTDIALVQSPVSEVLKADEIIITNSLLRCVGVRKLNHQYLPGFSVRSLCEVKSW